MATLLFALQIAILASFSCWLGIALGDALRSGVARAASTRYHRGKQPVMFWLTVVVQAGFALLFFALLVCRLWAGPTTGAPTV